MKVVLFPSSVDPVGVSIHVMGLARLLAHADLLHCVVCPKEGWLTDILSREGISYRILDAGFHWSQYYPSVVRLFRLLYSFRGADELIMHLHGRFPLFVALLPVMLRRNVRFVVTVHQFAAASSPGIIGWKIWLETILLRRVSRIWCVSQALRDEVVERIGYQRAGVVEVIPNWIEKFDNNDQYNDTAVGVEGRSVRLCAVGRLSHEKGFDVLIEALSYMVAGGWNASCDIYGMGIEEGRLVALINRYDLQERVFLRGMSNEIRNILRDYHAIVVPSRSESFSIVALEAFDAGIPVVASNLPGLSEVVIHEKTGLTFEVENAHSLQEALERLLGSRELVMRLVTDAKISLKKYTPSSELEARIREFYELAIK